MEFKGTKGKWCAVDYAGTYYLLDGKYYEDENIFDSECVGEEVAKANANLAVNAPEMLDALHEIVCAFENNALTDVSFAKELIKKATTI